MSPVTARWTQLAASSCIAISTTPQFSMPPASSPGTPTTRTLKGDYTMAVATLLNAASAPGPGAPYPPPGGRPVYEGKAITASLTGTGQVTATLNIEVTIDPVNGPWVKLAQITLNGAAPQADGFSVTSLIWGWLRANLIAIS